MFKVSPIQLLGQVRPANTTAVAIYTAAVLSEITTLNICNTSVSSVKFRVFHDVGGSTYDESNALHWDVALASGQTVSLDAGEHGWGLNATDTLGVRTDTASALTFTAYGRKVTARRES